MNLGLLSLDKLNLQVLIELGTPVEQKRAKKILKIRKRGNYLLCTLLLGNGLLLSFLHFSFIHSIVSHGEYGDIFTHG